MRVFVFGLLLGLLIAASAQACDCVVPSSPSELVERSSVVGDITIIEASILDDAQKDALSLPPHMSFLPLARAKVRVDYAIKGASNGDEFVVYFDVGSSCKYEPMVGAKKTLFVSNFGSMPWVSACNQLDYLCGAQGLSKADFFGSYDDYFDQISQGAWSSRPR